VAKKTIFIAAGGTGGHLFPAIYIAQAIKKLEPTANIIAIGAGRPLEKKLYTDWNLQYEIIPTVGLKNRGLKGVLEFLFSFPKSIVKTIKLFLKYKPSAVVGVGGYVTAFPVCGAWFFGIPSWIHEAEIKPGMANLFLSFFSQKISVAFNECTFPRVIEKTFTGHPVRQGLETAKRSTAITSKPKNILILGGSQGAQSLDDAAEVIARFAKLENLSIVHQCRAQNVEQVKNSYQQMGLSDYSVVSFIDDVISSYVWADIIVSRSGAGSVSELSVVNKPVIFVPFPFAQADHQTKNANTLVKIGKAVLCPEGELFQDRIITEILKLMNIDRYNEMVSLPQKVAHQDAAHVVATGVLSLISA
jgi:UDP-N-acetylglucosamine--N-acetylmuramyl-(pentapeptide) pyrophosphoryl-undecaprenol N-acetylglucosamine transferase